MNRLTTSKRMTTRCGYRGIALVHAGRVSWWIVDLSPEQTEADLLRKTAAGDADAFSQLYDRTCRVLFSLACRILRDRTAAEDLLQDVFLQVWDKARSYDAAQGKPLTWLIVLTRNRAIDRLRARQRFEQILETARLETGANDSRPPAVTTPGLDAEQSRQIRAALDQLPNEQRQAIELAFFGGLTQTEIAEKLSAPLGTVKARIRRGMLQLRDALKRSDRMD